MEFNQKLQELRKQRGLTQEALAQALFVSRTAVSKWESGRGYPNIESLKRIAKVFSVTVDELLSGEELLTIAEEDNKKNKHHVRDLVFGLLDLGASLFLFLPFFAQKADGTVQEVSLLSLVTVSLYLKITFLIVVFGIIVLGILTLVLQNCRKAVWVQFKSKLSLILNVLSIFVFIISLQPYAASLLFVFLIIKVSLVKMR